MKDSIPYKEDEVCDCCHKVAELGDYNGKRYCKDCQKKQEGK